MTCITQKKDVRRIRIQFLNKPTLDLELSSLLTRADALFIKETIMLDKTVHMVYCDVGNDSFI